MSAVVSCAITTETYAMLHVTTAHIGPHIAAKVLRVEVEPAGPPEGGRPAPFSHGRPITPSRIPFPVRRSSSSAPPRKEMGECTLAMEALARILYRSTVRLEEGRRRASVRIQKRMRTTGTRLPFRAGAIDTG